MDKEKRYKNILFDLGGVIMNLDRMECVKAYTNLGLTIANELLGEYVQEGPFLALESGLLSNDEFRNEIRKHLSAEVSDSQIDAAFNEFLRGIPLSRLKALEQLRKEYKLYVLSNTNAIMWNSKIKKCFEIDGKEIGDYFDGIVTSFEAKCVKPDARIFQYTIDTLGIDPKETLFFDDGQKNLEAASKFGFGTYLVKQKTEFMSYFTDNIEKNEYNRL